MVFRFRFEQMNYFKKTFYLIITSLLLAGCQTAKQATSISFYHKTGSTIYSKQGDWDNCKIQSFRVIPQAIGHSTTPGSYSPGSTFCSTNNGFTSCSTIGDSYEAPTITSYDMNSKLRNNFINQCMANKGYKNYLMDYCTNGGGYSNLNPAPPISQIQCLDRSKTYTLE